MNLFSRHRTALALGLFGAIFVALTVCSYTRESATWDEPIHLLSGYAMLEHGDYRCSPDHQPLLRMWAALPLLVGKPVAFDPGAIRRTDSIEWLRGRQFLLAYEFLYLRNDADALLDRARFMIVLLGVALGGLLFFWARERFGFWPAAFALGTFALEPNLLANSSILTADLGLACLVFGAGYFLWRTSRVCSVPNVAGLALCVAMAMVSKFWGILLLPIVAGLLGARVTYRRPWPCRPGRRPELVTRTARGAAAVAVFAIVLATVYVGIWAAYGFRYGPDPAGKERFHCDADPFVLERTPGIAHRLAWIDRAHLLPNAYLEGFIFGAANIQQRSAYLAGKFSTVGWWYYFPVAFLIKTPLSLLAGLAAGLVFCLRRWRESWFDDLFVVAPPLVFFAVAMKGNIDIGVRYVLLVYPFAILLAAGAAAGLARSGRKWIPIALLVVAAAELAWVYPHCLAFFNGLVGGPAHGSEYLIDSNLDWGQDLKGLKRWMDERDIPQINLSYFGTADPAYYHIRCIQLPGAPFFAENQVRAPQLPGFVAVSATNLRGGYMNDLGRAFYRPLLDEEPIDQIGYSIFVYWIERPWWK